MLGEVVVEGLALPCFFFAKNLETETTFFLVVLKGEALSQDPNCWSSRLRLPSLSIQVSQSRLSCMRQPHQ